MEITADNINVSSDDPAVSQWTPLNDFPCLGCRQITPGLPSGVPTENGGSHVAAYGFFLPITPQIPTGRRAQASRRPGGIPRDAGR